jgi:hypothetical protein
MVRVIAASQLAVSREVILPQAQSQLKNSLVGDNFDQLPDPVLSSARRKTYSERTVNHNAVELVRHPPRTRLFGGKHFLIENDGLAVQEQVPPPPILRDAEEVQRLAAEEVELEEIQDPCVMVSRFGVMVWGHWLGELLPRILLTELAFPGRFKYVLPPHLFEGYSPRNVWNSIWDTIRLLGVTKERVLLARYDRHYLFSNLHSVTSVLTDGVIHPDTIQQIRAAYITRRTLKPVRRIAILRTESKARNISNVREVIAELRSRDYELVEVGTIPFQEQIHLFSTASIVVGVLASGLTGLLFSPDRVRALSFAPQGYINTFFYSILQSRNAAYYDVRGQITERDPRSDIFSSFEVRPGDLGRGLDCIEQPGESRPSRFHRHRPLLSD